jgi:hypothetical protein
MPKPISSEMLESSPFFRAFAELPPSSTASLRGAARRVAAAVMRSPRGYRRQPLALAQSRRRARSTRTFA